MKKILRKIVKRIILYIFNKHHQTKIRSIDASINAKYGIGVSISENTTVLEDVTIGDYSYVNAGSYVENCVIGKFCSISSGVYICPYEHAHSMKTTHPIIHEKKIKAFRQPVIIGNDVLISLNVIILEGITVGDGAVIGAGAVVTKDVKPYEVVGGVPAKHIKYRFPSDQIEKLLKIQWWDWDISKINRNIDYLKNETEFIHI